MIASILSATPPAGIGVFEVDEGALPSVVNDLRPRMLVLTNVFRDQLDRFAEPERVARLLREGADRLPRGSRIVANADDPLLWASLEDLWPVGFSVSGVLFSPESGSDAEPETCPLCAGSLRFERRTIANLGSGRCDGCGWRSSSGSYRATLISQAGLEASVLEVCGELLTLPMGGIHNAYNAVAAIAAAAEMGIPPHGAISVLEEFQPRFGRAEELLFDGGHLWVALIKNPAGAGAVIQGVCADGRVGALVVAISDRDADGRDVSWIWDADFERLVRLGVPVVAAGTRADDVAVRAKYAGRAPDAVEAEPLAAIQAAVERCRPDAMVVVLATYTAMLDIRQALLGDRSARIEDSGG